MSQQPPNNPLVSLKTPNQNSNDANNPNSNSDCGGKETEEDDVYQNMLITLKTLQAQNKRLTQFQEESYKWHMQHHENIKSVIASLNDISQCFESMGYSIKKVVCAENPVLMKGNLSMKDYNNSSSSIVVINSSSTPRNLNDHKEHQQQILHMDASGTNNDDVYEIPAPITTTSSSFTSFNQRAAQTLQVTGSLPSKSETPRSNSGRIQTSYPQQQQMQTSPQNQQRIIDDTLLRFMRDRKGRELQTMFLNLDEKSFREISASTFKNLVPYIDEWMGIGETQQQALSILMFAIQTYPKVFEMIDPVLLQSLVARMGDVETGGYDEQAVGSLAQIYNFLSSLISE